MNATVVKNARIDVVDALRGFAVMAIILVHNIEHFIFPVYPTEVPQWLNVLDQGVHTVIFTLFAGKSYSIFALLFGFTFFIQSDNQRRKGKDFGYRFLWRLVLLAGFATLNAAFFPAGDVLLLFTCVALVLFITRNWSDKYILIAAIVLLLQPVEWIHFIISLFDATHQLPDLNVGDMYAAVAEYTKEGDFWNFVFGNITLGQKASLFWAINAGRFVQTGGLFLLGFYLGRKHLFVTSRKNIVLWNKILIVSTIAYAPLYALKEQIMTNDLLVQQTAGTTFDMWQKLAFTLVVVSAFVLLYQHGKFQKLVNDLRFYGKMSLTNYITQSIIGAFIYLPFGLYLAPSCGFTVSLFIGIGIFYVQMKCCKWWLAHHKYGPLEYIWQRWTWIKSGK